MKKHGSAVAAGGPAREQAREAVPVEARRAGRARCREVRDALAARQPSRWLCACVLAEAEARVEAVPARRCLRGGAEGLAGERGAAMRHGRWVRTAKRAGGPSGPLTYTHLPCRAGKTRQNVGIPRFRPHAKSHGNARWDCYEKCEKR